MRRVSAIAAVAALAMLGLAACGGDDDNGTTAAATPPATTTAGGGGGGGGGSTVDISTPPGSDLAYDQKDVSAKAGSVTIDFDNMQAQSHDVKVEDSSGQEIGGTDLVSSNTATATVDLQSGTYTFFCSVPGHREAGMEGTLTVK
ncbi:MAG TPA: plastocyanin/azurin family copper-binding protein [Solirubrobacterales bacterium]